MEIKGKIFEISETQIISEKFAKRAFIVEQIDNPKYPEYIPMEFIQDNCDRLNDVNIGDNVIVSVNLKGRLWTNSEGVRRCFLTLQAWKINKENIGSKPTGMADNKPIQDTYIKDNVGDVDTLPFMLSPPIIFGFMFFCLQF